MDIKESWLMSHPKLFDDIGTPSILYIKIDVYVTVNVDNPVII